MDGLVGGCCQTQRYVIRLPYWKYSFDCLIRCTYNDIAAFLRTWSDCLQKGVEHNPPSIAPENLQSGVDTLLMLPLAMRLYFINHSHVRVLVMKPPVLILLLCWFCCLQCVWVATPVFLLCLTLCLPIHLVVVIIFPVVRARIITTLAHLVRIVSLTA